MARRRGGGGGGGAPEWLVTFADLMSLLVCFFVLIISFSNQDEKKMALVSGSMREAFGSQTDVMRAGLMEKEGTPDNPFFRDVTKEPLNRDTNIRTESDTPESQSSDTSSNNLAKLDVVSRDLYMSAAASLRQALQELPDVTEVSKNIILRVDEDGLHIELVDQDGRAMFPDNSRYPYPRMEQILSKIAPVIRQMPNKISITGHTSFGPNANASEYSDWELSADRAETVRKLLVNNGIRVDQVSEVVGKGDTKPLFVNDPYLAANRRVTILLMHEPPPIPSAFKP